MLPSFLLDIPVSTIFVFLLAAAISLATSLTNRLLTNPAKTRTWRKEISEWNSELRKAQRSQDKRRVEKLMKQQQAILKLQSKMMWQSMKVSLLFFIPLILIWQILGGFFMSPDGQPIHIAYFPGAGPIISLPILGNMVSLFWWYLLCSFLWSTTFSHVFGLVSVE